MPLIFDDNDNITGCEHTIPAGERRLFAYPAAFTTLPEYDTYRGQIVTILRPLTEAQCDLEQQPMYRVRADDGWEGDAWEDELDGGTQIVGVGSNGKLTISFEDNTA